MHLECVQQLLAHSNLEMTLRYARLSDRSREEQYFKAMAIIEQRTPMDLSNVIINYRRYLKRRNYSSHTVKIIWTHFGTMCCGWTCPSSRSQPVG
jgi:hypothetical protein